MTGGEITTLAALAALGVFISAVFSGMETGVYTLNRVRLTVRAARRQGRPVMRSGTAISRCASIS